MKLITSIVGIALALATAFSPPAAYAVFPAVTFNEVVHSADIIFSGTVASIDYKTSGSTVYTEAAFTDVSIQHSTARSVQKNRERILLRYAGGQVENDTFLDVSDMPRLQTGHRYMVFALDDGVDYLTPIVGGPQGLYEIITDPRNGKPVVATPGGRGFSGVSRDGMPELTAAPVTGRPGRVAPEEPEVEPPVAPDGRRAAPSRVNRDAQTSPPLTIQQFQTLIRETLQKPAGERRLKSSSKDSPPFHYLGSLSGLMRQQSSRQQLSADERSRGQTLAVCGTHLLPIIMQQRPESESEHQIISGCLDNFNQYMDVFQSITGTGTFDGGNLINEFGGKASSSQITAEYRAFNWGSSLGVCWTYRVTGPACNRITESDVFWSPFYTFTTDPQVWFKSTNNTYNLRAVLIHEIGHVWGHQTGGEAYNYDDPSIMHAVYNTIYETGEGLHARDASIFRTAYQGQTPVKNFNDIGVESYHASNGLKSSAVSPASVRWEEPLNFSNVTVENMSNSTVNNARIRFFLSDQMGFAGNTFQVGQQFVFPSIAAETKSVNSYTANLVPRGIPSGSYFVLAKVDLGEGVYDSFAPNDFAVFTGKVTITAPTLLVSPSALTSTASAGTHAAARQITVSIGGSTDAAYSLSVEYTSGTPGWLSVDPESSHATTNVTVSHNSASLPAGTYTADIIITGESGFAEKRVPVTLTVSPATGVDEWATY